MPRTLLYAIKFISVLALVIVISVGRVELASAYHQQPDATQIANEDGKDKADHGNGKDKDNAKGEAKADSKSEAKANSETKASDKSEARSANTAAQANNMSGPPGNNGTVKVHEGVVEVTPERQEDSHVCIFHLHGFNFDGGSTGTWDIAPQAPGGGPGAHGNWGPADSSGEWRTSGATTTLADGHYKLSWRQVVPTAPGGDKHKVFWVECAAQGRGHQGGQQAEKAQERLSSAIGNVASVSAQLATSIGVANQLLLTGNLTVEQRTALTNAVGAAVAAQALLTEKFNAAQTALTNLVAAINSGTAEQIAIRVDEAERARANLNEAISGAAKANAQLGTTITASGGIAITGQTITNSSVEERTEREVTTATTGGMTTVAGSQSSPQMSESSQTASQAGAQSATTGVQAGVQNLPSTNTSDETAALVILGLAFMAFGGALLRRQQITVR
jgi:LPXTG-motif cell wall-anchored protein